MNNGCICCTVRGDLVRILSRLMKRKDKLDGVIIVRSTFLASQVQQGARTPSLPCRASQETTGMADPAPVAQTFFMDPSKHSHSHAGGATFVYAGPVNAVLICCPYSVSVD